MATRFESSIRAPEFPAGMAWLNVKRPLTLAELRGKLVILDFWTFCCINCQHMLPVLRKLEHKYRDELVVIGVHSAKFMAEKSTDAIHQAIGRHGVEHPVINDRDFEVWQHYAVRAWPTLMFVSPDGRVLGKHEGEAPFDGLDRLVGEMVRQYDERGLIDRSSLDVLVRQPLPSSGLAYPGKLIADAVTDRLYVSDSAHNRVVEATLNGRVLRVFGDGEAGLKDGAALQARFHTPQGLALDESWLFVADAENHAVRAIDLADGTVRTLAGIGEQAMGRSGGGPALQVALSSPPDLALVDDTLYLAMAGFHQIWALDLGAAAGRAFAGNGRESITDGPREQAEFAQPVGLASDGRYLWAADSETSSVRQIDLASGEVTSLVGLGLFVFGDEDGVGEDVRLQHAEGLALGEDGLLLADTFNNKIKRLDLATRAVTTLAGQENPGFEDGVLASARFDGPAGLSAIGQRIYVADTNNHAIRLVDLAAGTVSTLELTDLD